MMNQEQNQILAVEEEKPYHTLVIGNEKGGSGKTTTTMHIITSLLRLGFSVGSIDLDSRQQSLSRYIENRRANAAKEGISLPMPEHYVITKASQSIEKVADADRDEHERFMQAYNKLAAEKDFIIIDTPGSDSYLSRLAHSYADTIVTPINDSFVDFDVLAKVDGRTYEIVRPSIYSEMIWNQRLTRAKREGSNKAVDWIVMRNRLSHLDAKNKRQVADALDKLSKRIGFRVAPGFSERVIFRELFLKGFTLLDVMEPGADVALSLSHIAARQEVRELLKTLNIKKLNERLENKPNFDQVPSERKPQEFEAA